MGDEAQDRVQDEAVGNPAKAPQPDADWDYPRGWFVVGFSDELAPLQSQNLTYFGKDWVLYRGAGGQAYCVGAYCPHLGAHLGHGGQVEGETIRCPFHAWRFDGKGPCVEVPYARKIPPRAALAVLPLKEVCGVIYVYFDPEGGEARYEPPQVEGYDSDEWTRWDHSMLSIRTRPREIVENVADLAHFQPVHGTVPKVFENEFKGHLAIQYNEGVAYPRGGGEDHYILEATYHGPGVQITHMGGVLKSTLINAHTPIDTERLHLRFGVSLNINPDHPKAEAFAAQYIDNLRTGFLEDVAIWENKKWRDKPMLCQGDGPLGKLRKWYRQFYRPRLPEARASS